MGFSGVARGVNAAPWNLSIYRRGISTDYFSRRLLPWKKRASFFQKKSARLCGLRHNLFDRIDERG
jgi:hypothetical protein